MANELQYALKLAEDGFTNPARKAEQATKRLKGEVEGTGGAATRGGSGLASFASKAKSLAITAGVVTGALAVLAVGFTGLKSAVGPAMEMEATKKAFKTLIGDMEQTEETLNRLQVLSASTPFQFAEDIAPAAKSLIAFGTAAEEVPAALSRIGDVASAVGAPLGEMSEIFGKAKVQGTLFAEDLNQLMGRGVPVLQELAGILGVSEGEIKKLASEGKITFPLLDQAFRNMTREGGKFFNMMEEQSQTSLGMISTLKDNLVQFATRIGEPINDGMIKPMLTQAMALSESLGTGIIAIFDIVKGAIESGNLGSLLSAGLELGFQSAVNFGVGAFQTLGQVLDGAWEFGMARLETLFSPSTWQQIGQLVAGAITVGFIGLPQIIDGLATKMRANFGESLQTVVSQFQAGLEFAIQKVMEGLANIPGLSEFLGLEGFQADTYEAILAGAKARNNSDALNVEADEKIKSGMDDIASGLKASAAGFGGLFQGYTNDLKDAFGNVTFAPAEIFDTADAKAKLTELAKSSDPAAFDALLSAMKGVSGEVEKIDNEADKAAEGLDAAIAAAKAGTEVSQKGGKASASSEVAKETEKRIGLYNLEESALRRLARMSDADKAKFGKSALDDKGGPSGLDYLRKNPIKDIAESELNLKKGAFTGLDGGLMAKVAAGLGNQKNLESSGIAKDRQLASQQKQQEKARWDSVVRIETLFENLAVA